MDKVKKYGQANELNLKTMIALSRSSNRIAKQLNDLFRTHELTMMQFAVLEVLYHKGDLRIKEILEKILATGGNMTVVIQNLEREGYVKKGVDPNDSRASVIKITKRGIAVMEEVFPEHLIVLQASFRLLSEEDQQQLICLLRKIGA